MAHNSNGNSTAGLILKLYTRPELSQSLNFPLHTRISKQILPLSSGCFLSFASTTSLDGRSFCLDGNEAAPLDLSWTRRKRRRRRRRRNALKRKERDWGVHFTKKMHLPSLFSDLALVAVAESMEGSLLRLSFGPAPSYT